MKPLFIFSLPRSGSTLLQRILANHPEIATISEPWLLLPQIYSLKNSGILAEYSHQNALKAINEFCTQLPGGRQDYLEEVRHFISRLYEKASTANTQYFIDKTPRYNLIANEILDIFPDGKFIFLWRNPLSVCASIQQTWAQEKWNIYNYQIDLYKGLECSLIAYSRHRSDVFSLRFEDLTHDPQKHISAIFDYIGIPYKDDVLTKLPTTSLNGEMGDQVGIKQYSSINKEPVEKWKNTIKNPFRKRWAIKYLHWIGEQRLQLMGYSLESLLKEIKENPGSLEYLYSDTLRFIGGTCCTFFEYPQVKQKIMAVRNQRRTYYHS